MADVKINQKPIAEDFDYAYVENENGALVRVSKDKIVKLGADGGYYTPYVDTEGNLSWIKSKEEMATVSVVNIKGAKGEKGDKGDKGDTGAKGAAGTSMTVKSTNESSADGGSNVITFSDGTILTVKNGSKGSTGATGAAGKTPVKGTDYWTDEDKSKIIAEIQLKLDEIPNYWSTALETGAKEINTALCAAGSNKSAFLFYSDAHWTSNSQMSPMLLKYLYKHTGLTKTIFGGDVVDNEGTDYDVMKYLWEWRKALKDLPNHHSVVGNHDDGNATDHLFDVKYVYGYLQAAEETPDVVRDTTGLWYYIDDPSEHTRYLYLDTGYQGAIDAQVTFVTNALLSTPENWHIVAVSHIWYAPDYDKYYNDGVKPIPIVGVYKEADVFIKLFDNYNNRSGAFANGKGKVEFCIGGHCHRDYDGTTSSGIPIILVETDSQHLRSELTYTAGTTKESSVNGIIADYDAKKITVARVGRGKSRTVSLDGTIIEPSGGYTNQISKSTDASGNLYNNGQGWKADTRLNSSGNEVGAVGIEVTGFIPMTKGDVLRFANMKACTSYSANASSNSSQYIAFYDSSKSLLRSYKTSDIFGTGNQSGYYQYDDSGYLTYYDSSNLKGYMSNADSVAYFRISAEEITSNSIITVNEEIT